jgi:predicted metalloprotease with PDZ domain
MRTEVTWEPARDRQGRPAVERSIFGYLPSDNALRLYVTNPESPWGRAGLHTGDRLMAFNGTRIRTWPEMRAALLALSIGDTVRVDVMRLSGPWSTTVRVAGYDRPVVKIVPIANATAKQRMLRSQWEAGTP